MFIGYQIKTEDASGRSRLTPSQDMSDSGHLSAQGAPVGFKDTLSIGLHSKYHEIIEVTFAE